MNRTSRAKSKHQVKDLLRLHVTRVPRSRHRAEMDGRPINRPGLSAHKSAKANGPNTDQKLLVQLEAENAELRDRVVDLMLQIQLRRDGASSHGSRRPLLRTVKSR
jgi:hypothetical protein